MLIKDVKALIVRDDMVIFLKEKSFGAEVRVENLHIFHANGDSCHLETGVWTRHDLAHPMPCVIDDVLYETSPQGVKRTERSVICGAMDKLRKEASIEAFQEELKETPGTPELYLLERMRRLA